MGLDTVELVMAIEEEFDVTIPDDTAEEMVRVRDVRDWLVAHLHTKGRDADPDDVFTRLRRLTSHTTNIPEDEIGLDARFIDDLAMD